MPAFGLNLAQHTLPTRQGLGFGMESERNALEAHWSGEAWHGAISASESRQGSRVGERERGASFQLERFFLDRHRVGFSIWNGESDRQKRWIGSLHGILGFTESLYLLTETALQSKRTKSATGDRDSGIYHFGRLGYEIVKGFHLLALEELSKSNLSNPRSFQLSVGSGVLWYPRPHFEFELTFNQRKNLQQSREFEDYAYLLLHYYL